MNNNFAENLKKLRKENNLSQEQLAEELGVSRQAISKWESSLAYPEMDKIIALCDKFNLNIDDLLHKDIKEIKGEEEVKNNINKGIDDFLKFITNTLNLFCKMNFKSKIKCLFEQIIIISFLVIISAILFVFSKYIILGIFAFLPTKINHIVCSLINNIILLFLFIASLIIFIHIFKTRYLDYYTKLEISKKSNVEEPVNLNQENIILKEKEAKIIFRNPENEYRFINGLFKMILGIIKFFAIFVVLGLSFTLICFFFSFVISFLIFKTGLFFIGLLLAILSCATINIILLLLVINFIFSRKNSKKIMVISFIASIATFGISLGLIFIGSLNFSIVTPDLKTASLELTMTDNLFIDNNNIEYIPQNIDNIIIESQVPNLCNLKAENIYSNDLILYSECKEPLKVIKEAITNLNHYKILDLNNDLQNIKVYASSENINKLKQNIIKYYEYENSYNAEITAYENAINNYVNQITNYEEKIAELENELANYKNNQFE